MKHNLRRTTLETRPLRSHRREQALRRLMMAALLLAFAPGPGYARKGEPWENLKQLQVGQKIEVVDMTLKSLTGTFVSFSDEAISLRNRGGDVTVVRADVLRVSLREHTKRTRNVLIGAAIGAAAGAAFAAWAGAGEALALRTVQQ